MEKQNTIIERVENGFWPLRRWNSFSPVIPRPEGNPVGGGYFLQWDEEGIVIDPGYNFLENFLYIGGQPKDIDSIILTHNHPDHDANVERIFTALHEMNDRKDPEEDPKKIKLFFNQTTKWKYMWAMDYEMDIVSPDSFTLKVGNCQEISDNIEVEPIEAFHKELIGYSSIGLKLYLKKNNKVKFRIGITGDTTIPAAGIKKLAKPLEDCDIVVAHLGTLDIGNLLQAVEFGDNIDKRIQNIINDFNLKFNFKNPEEKAITAKVLNCKEDNSRDELDDRDQIKFNNEELIRLLKGNGNKKEDDHLGLKGVYDIFNYLFNKKEPNENIIGIISEFGEEVGSQRHKIARTLNRKLLGDESGKKGKSILTGDTNLTINLDSGECPECEDSYKVGFRCARCKDFFCSKCIEELCIKHRDKRIYYNCSNCYNLEYNPPRGEALPLQRLKD